MTNILIEKWEEDDLYNIIIVMYQEIYHQQEQQKYRINNL